MRCGSWPVGVMAILLGIFQLVHGAPFCVQETKQLLSPESTAIENRLYTLANKERESRGLPPLHFSEGLAGVARRHSTDLALSGALSHVSSSGETLQDRLVGAGFFFARAGENVARGETYVADLIHRALMESSEHRENILDPGFDTVGNGAVKAQDGTYFVAQDFIRAVEPLSEKAARSRMAERIQEWRSARSLPPLVFQEDAARLAQRFAEARIAGTPTPSLADLQIETHVFIVVSPLLEELDERSLHVDSPDYDEGGIGVCFGRMKDLPGGAYCVVLALLPRSKHISLTDRGRSEAVIRAVNSVRQNGGVGLLRADEGLAKEAANIAAQVSSGPRYVPPTSPGRRQRYVFSFRGNDLEHIPPEIEEALLAPNLVRIGVHALFVRSKEQPRGEYLVIGVVE